MAAVMPSALGHWPQQMSAMWSDSSAHFSNYAPMTQGYMPPLPAPVQHHQQQPNPPPSQSTPWAPVEDIQLKDAKSRGLGWAEIQTQYFPFKSANACRKRHERLISKLRATDWNDERIRRVSTAYTESKARERFWSEIARRVGEDRWQDVERVCFQQGLKNLKPMEPGHSRARSRASSGNIDYERASSADVGGDDIDAKFEQHDDSGFVDEPVSVSRRSSHHGHSQSMSALPVVSSGVQIPSLGAVDTVEEHILAQQSQHLSQRPYSPQHVRRTSQQYGSGGMSMYHR